MDAYVDRSWYGKLGLYAVAAFVARANSWSQLQVRWVHLLHEADPALDVTAYGLGQRAVGARKINVSGPSDTRETVLKWLVVFAQTSLWQIARVRTENSTSTLGPMRSNKSCEGKSLMKNVRMSVEGKCSPSESTC